ncbi:hypothetical protein Agub_g11912 [Astrephomene gubernaculifera]|uniref:F-box domain-containing protein n=1 Tax=Astrephomene gubernaculifera TaxID=47775 RepID=A0AAD3DXA3_9CHLO|nr:hypothetical protein Agub_g11912 [Astrephomene gubernaculifera]
MADNVVPGHVHEGVSTLLSLHNSLLQDILGHMDIQSRVAASATCKRLAKVSAEHPPTVVDLSSDGVHPEACRQFIERSKGAIVAITSARHKQRTACAATSARRFNSGLRCTQVVPYTARRTSAVQLASYLPRLRQLVLHEATSCLGGMTDELAAAVAAHCPGLEVLEVAFARYSLPSEVFTDKGVMCLAAGCPRLTRVALTHCGALTDRSLYSLASHCRGLTSISLGGYHELITDYGAVVLFQACPGLTRVSLSGKLRRVTDVAVEALAAACGGSLRELKLTRSMGDRSLSSLARHCRRLARLDCRKCDPTALTAGGVAALMRALGEPVREQQQQREQEQQQTTAVMGGDGSTGGSSSSSSGPSAGSGVGSSRGVLRVLLPPGLRAEEVVRRGMELSQPPGDNGAAADAGVVGSMEGVGATEWRVVRPSPLPSSSEAIPGARKAGGGGVRLGGPPAAVKAAVATEEVVVRLR